MSFKPHWRKTDGSARAHYFVQKVVNPDGPLEKGVNGSVLVVPLCGFTVLSTVGKTFIVGYEHEENRCLVCARSLEMTHKP